MSEEVEPVKVKDEETRDWVDEAYECFIKNATDLEPTDPVKAIGAYFEKNATAELKEQAKAEGKTPTTCWRFIETVSRKALHGSGHIDHVAVYAIAMHYFQDVPADWNKPKEQPKPKTDANKTDAKLTKKWQKKSQAGVKAAETRAKKKSEEVVNPQTQTPATAKQTSETDKETSETTNAPVAVSAAPAKKTEKKPSKKHYKKTQGFFFDMMETAPVGEKVQA